MVLTIFRAVVLSKDIEDSQEALDGVNIFARYANVRKRVRSLLGIDRRHLLLAVYCVSASRDMSQVDREV
jgi:hypothetical protein